MNDKLILVLFQHKTFGWKFNIYSAQLLTSGSMQILGTPTLKQEKEKNIPAEILEMIKIINETSDQALMKSYSKKKSTTEFKNEISKETLEHFVRPRIEIVNNKIIDLLQHSDIPVYIREDLTNKTLYERYKLSVLKSQSECTFNFEINETGIKYHISLNHDGKEILLLNKQGIIISEKPSMVLIGNEIHSIKNIESKKLVPFFEKKHITVPPQSVETYLKSFVIKIMLTNNVKIEGIPVMEIKPEKKAYLFLENDFDQNLVLSLLFQYNNNKKLHPELNIQKTIELKKNNDLFQIEWYNRDIDWEQNLILRLKNTGLIYNNRNQFYLNDNENQYSLIEWLNQNKINFSDDFIFEQNLAQIYYTETYEIHSELTDKIDWFEINIQVTIGNYKIPFSRFRKHILAKKKEFVLPDKSIFILPEEWFEQYHGLFSFSEEENTLLRMKKIHAPILNISLKNLLSKQQKDQIKDLLKVPDKQPIIPIQINAVLRPYQKEGFFWLEHLYKNNFGGCLADDMGLGKTLQTITFLQYIYENSDKKELVATDGQLSLFDEKQADLPASLIVAPTSLLHNWKNEISRFAPELKVYIYAGSKRIKTRDIQKIFAHYQIIITSYGTVRNDIEFIRNYLFQTIILDESQYIKNPDSQSYQSVKQLSSNHRFVLTGTPIENSLEDLWAQFNFINEGLLGNFTSFRKNFIQKITKENNSEKERLLKTIISPFLLRRTKQEVTPELPALQQEVIYCDMSEAQESIYEIEKNRIRNILLQAKEQTDASQRNFIALEGLSKLRQLANHPKMILPEYEEDSGKFDQILLSFESLKANNHKVLIFSSYVKHLDLLAHKFDTEGWKYAMLTGKTKEREKEINRFINEDDIHCFFISLKTGATGLNLTVADYVFIIDPWWNPAIEMQALSRAHRIGQTQSVIAYRFISSETVEEKIIQLQKSKNYLFETFVNSSNPFQHLSWDEIENLFL